MNSNWDQSIVLYLVVVVNDLLLNLVLRMDRREELGKSEQSGWDLGKVDKVDTVDHSLTSCGMYSSEIE